MERGSLKLYIMPMLLVEKFLWWQKVLLEDRREIHADAKQFFFLDFYYKFQEQTEPLIYWNHHWYSIPQADVHRDVKNDQQIIITLGFKIEGNESIKMLE